jgi:heme exporter protein C
MLMTWWKYLCIALLIYASCAGFLVPLKPGIQSTSPAMTRAGAEVQVSVLGYNTFYKKGEKGLNAWLKLDSVHLIKAYQLEVKDERNLVASFRIPQEIAALGKQAGVRLTLITSDPESGVALLPQAIFVATDSVESNNVAGGWHTMQSNELLFKHDLTFPYRNILYETIRNTYFHVPLWFAMMVLFGISVYHSIVYLSGLGKQKLYDEMKESDMKSAAYSEIGLSFGFLGLFTGMLWANYTWGTPWTGDIKLNMTAVLLAIYLAYFVLRMAFYDKESAARLSAVYNIFAFASIIPLLFIIPRMAASLHPGNGGNPAIGGEDLDNTMRLVFYPAVIGFILLGIWMSDLNFRTKRIREVVEESIV